ncbi:MAG: carbohydrate kinase [Chitinophagaceae bacterium]|nr:carbohydrate kinase [Chitinophagaceae bacterium]
MSYPFTEKTIRSTFSKLKKLKVFIVGDAMIDQYWRGQIDRISPEAPVPIISVNQKDARPGGAANVALNCRALGAEVYLFTVLGKDHAAKELIQQLQIEKIHTEGCLQSADRVTTIKTRVIAKNQQVFRLDEENHEDLSVKDEHRFIDTCLRAIQIEKPDILIFEDYNKGVLKLNVIEKIINHCKHVGVLTAVDPKKNNFLSYRQVDLFKPNLKEVREALNIQLAVVNEKHLKQVHEKLQNMLNHKITLITLSELGVFVQQEKQSHLYPAHFRNISDVSGAGDTVIAVAAALYAIHKDISMMAYISNIAGGLVCEEAGVVPINVTKLLEEALSKIK